MVAFRLASDYEERLKGLAARAGMTPGAYARRALIAVMEGREDLDARLEQRLSRIEKLLLTLLQSQLQQTEQLTSFLEVTEVIDPM